MLVSLRAGGGGARAGGKRQQKGSRRTRGKGREKVESAMPEAVPGKERRDLKEEGMETIVPKLGTPRFKKNRKFRHSTLLSSWPPTFYF